MKDLYKKKDGTWYDDDIIVINYVAQWAVEEAFHKGKKTISIKKIARHLFDLYEDLSFNKIQMVANAMNKVIETGQSSFKWHNSKFNKIKYYDYTPKKIFDSADISSFNEILTEKDMRDESIIDTLIAINDINASPVEPFSLYLKIMYIMANNNGYMIIVDRDSIYETFGIDFHLFTKYMSFFTKIGSLEQIAYGELSCLNTTEIAYCLCGLKELILEDDNPSLND